MPTLTPDSLPEDPLDLASLWLAEAEAQSGLDNPNAMMLATAAEDGTPESRIVLLKGLDHGFVFYTNRESRKGRELDAHGRAGLTFFWDVLGRQLRIVGAVERVSDEESDSYFESRPRGSQIGAWASEQSRPLTDRSELENRVKSLEERYAGQDVPRPPQWGGYRVVPDRIEFWQSGEYRLHDRFEYRRDENAWVVRRLNP